jgi:hypothetical protein
MELLKGVVLYEAQTIPFFTEKTVIDPASLASDMALPLAKGIKQESLSNSGQNAGRFSHEAGHRRQAVVCSGAENCKANIDLHRRRCNPEERLGLFAFLWLGLNQLP